MDFNFEITFDSDPELMEAGEEVKAWVKLAGIHIFETTVKLGSRVTAYCDAEYEVAQEFAFFLAKQVGIQRIDPPFENYHYERDDTESDGWRFVDDYRWEKPASWTQSA